MKMQFAKFSQSLKELHLRKRLSNIRRMETEIAGLRQRLGMIDDELDSIARAHFSKIGPRGETPAQLAQRVVNDRERFRWFVDRPPNFVSETGLSDPEMVRLAAARRRVGILIDHLEAALPSPADLPKP